MQFFAPLANFQPWTSLLLLPIFCSCCSFRRGIETITFEIMFQLPYDRLRTQTYNLILDHT